MANVTLPRSQTGNGTATPATAALAGVVSGDLLVCYIGCVGSTATSIATPTGDTWVSVQNQAGSGSGVPSFGMFILTNAGAGTHTPSSVLTGTLTGWIIVVLEFTATGANEGLISSAVQTSAVAQLTNAFPVNLGQAQPNELFLYSVLRIGATTISAPTSGLTNWAPPGYVQGASQWSASQAGLANIQGLSIDTYFGDSNNSWPCPYPGGAGLLSAAVNSVQIAAWLNAQATIPSAGGTIVNIGGLGGSYVGPFFQGMVGG